MKRMIGVFASQIRGFLREFLVYIVKRKGDTRKIIDKIEHNQMNGSHWKERQKMLAKSRERDVPEVRRDRHLDVLGHIGIDLAAFNQTFFQDHQVLIRRGWHLLFPWRYHSGIHGDPNVWDLRGWSIVWYHLPCNQPCGHCSWGQRMIRAFWSGDSLAKTVVVSTTCANSWSVIVSISLPKESARHLVLLFTDSLGDLFIVPS